jgi:GxxExxY protein
VCYGEVIVELKAVKKIGELEKAQLLHYLKATGFERGLLLNFGATSLQYQRFVYSAQKKSVQSVKSVVNRT